MLLTRSSVIQKSQQTSELLPLCPVISQDWQDCIPSCSLEKEICSPDHSGTWHHVITCLCWTLVSHASQGVQWILEISPFLPWGGVFTPVSQATMTDGGQLMFQMPLISLVVIISSILPLCLFFQTFFFYHFRLRLKSSRWLHWMQQDTPEHIVYFKVIWMAVLISPSKYIHKSTKI